VLLPSRDFLHSQNAQTITQQNYFVQAKVLKQHETVTENIKKCPPLATTPAFCLFEVTAANVI